jgi:hypothetical protein
MRIISWIEDKEIIKKILKHLNLWDTNIHDPPAKRLNISLNLPICLCVIARRQVMMLILSYLILITCLNNFFPINLPIWGSTGQVRRNSASFS